MGVLKKLFIRDTKLIQINRIKATMTFEKFNHFFWGLIPGIILPAVFIWISLVQFYPVDLNVSVILIKIFPGILMGKILMLSVFPNLFLVYIFYNQDSFKIANGIMTGAMPYLISSFFML